MAWLGAPCPCRVQGTWWGLDEAGTRRAQEPGLLRCATKGLSRQVCPRFTRSASPGRRVCVCPSHCCSAAQLCPTRRPPWPAARRASLCCTASQNLLRLMSMGSVTPSNHLIFCRPLLLPSVFPGIRVFSSESVLCVTWPKYWSFSVSISPSNEYLGLISFTMDWLDLLAVQGTLKSLLQRFTVRQHQKFSIQFSYGPTLTSISDYWKNQF